MIGRRSTPSQVRTFTSRELASQLVSSKDVSLAKYWDDVVCAKRPELGRYRWSSGATKVLCPFHPDNRPSMGIVRDAQGVEVFNCFGCGAKGTVVHMHRRLNGLEFLPEAEWCRELQSLGLLFGVSLSLSGVSGDDKPSGAFVLPESSYSFRSLERDVAHLRSVRSNPTVLAHHWDEVVSRALSLA